MSKTSNIGYHIINGILSPVSRLPLGYHRFQGRVFGWIAGNVLRYRRGVVTENLKACFPEKPQSELREITNRFYRHLGTIIGEAVWFRGCKARRDRLRKADIVRLHDSDLLNRLYAKGKSIMVLGGHCGNFEILAGYKIFAEADGGMDIPENDIAVVYHALTSPAWERFMCENRLSPIEDKEHFDGLVEAGVVMRYVYENRGTAKMYNFITDQYPYGEANRLELTFLGRPTHSMVGGQALAMMFGMPVVYMSYTCRPEGGYDLGFKLICEDAAESDMEYITKEYYRLLEQDIKAQPWNWLWTHRRWKNL